MNFPTQDLVNRVIHGDCVQVMRAIASRSVDFILTDPPYLVNYRARDGQTIANDNNDTWLKPAFAEMYRVLRNGSFCLSFYGWNKADLFIQAWQDAGFRIVGHVVFRKRYASSTRFFKNQHEQAYLLAKGAVDLPSNPLPDVIDWTYSGNRLHPTQKPLSALRPLIECFSRPGQIVFDPFCGSGSTLIAARSCARNYLGIELDARHHETASIRLMC